MVIWRKDDLEDNTGWSEEEVSEEEQGEGRGEYEEELEEGEREDEGECEDNKEESEEDDGDECRRWRRRKWRSRLRWCRKTWRSCKI